QGKAEQAAAEISDFTGGQVNGNGAGGPRRQMGLRAFLTDRRWLIMLAGTAGTWFLLDYAYYGNTISTPQILGLISPHASNMTTFVMPSELYPVTMRTTGHGISAGIGKFGAFIGVFLFPLLQTSLGLRGTLLLTAGVAVLGFALTLVLPEPAGRSLEDMPLSARETAARPLRVADQASAP